MITDSPMVLILLLLVLTALGGLIGYCVALIIIKNAARSAIEASRIEFMQEREAADAVLQKAKTGIEKPVLTDGQAYDRVASERERSLLEKSKGQTQHIQNLEAQLVSLEDQQQKLQRHFASYKANKNRELVVALNASGNQSDTDSLPTLSRKVDPLTGTVAAATSLHEKSSRTNASRPKRKSGSSHKGHPSDLDIPTLSESELPDLTDELEFDVAGSEGGGTHRGG